MTTHEEELNLLYNYAVDEWNLGTSARKLIDGAYAELEKELTPPTANEVCKAIQNELPHGNVEYIEGNKEFMFVNRGEKSNVTSVYGDSYKITGFYKSSTIMLIGRFYEGLGK